MCRRHGERQLGKLVPHLEVNEHQKCVSRADRSAAGYRNSATASVTEVRESIEQVVQLQKPISSFSQH